MRQGTVYSDMSIEPVNMPLALRPDKVGCDALMFAAHRGSAECVELLLSAGADGFARDELGDTALRRAMWARSLECVRLLIPRSHVDAKNRKGKPVLASAAEANEEIYEALLNVSRFAQAWRYE